MPEQEIIKVRYAWQVFRYFLKNQNLLDDKDNLKLYEKSKSILIKYYTTGDDKGTEKAITLLACVQIEKPPYDSAPTSEIISVILE